VSQLLVRKISAIYKASYFLSEKQHTQIWGLTEVW